jgi:microcystin degradation protein MlrC
MRVLLAEYAHESNCFAVVPASRERFVEQGLLTGATALATHRGRSGVLTGFIHTLEAAGHQPEVALAATAFPAGPVEAEFHAWAVQVIVDAAAKGWDGVLLSLHGAMAVEPLAQNPDPEGALVAAVRAALGPDVPVGVVLDPHSDTSGLLLQSATFTISYNEEPHRDVYDRGVEAAGLLLRIKGGLVVATARRRMPMLLPAINMATDEGPMADLHALRARMEATPGIIDISLHGGFYGSDQPEAGFGVTCIAENAALAQATADTMALAGWQRRHEFLVDLVTPAKGVELALKAGEPVGLIDEADDPAGGAACDSVLILRAMIAGGITSGGVSSIFDATSARACADAGLGGRITLALGAKLDPRHGSPLVVDGVVRAIHRGAMPIDQWTGKTYDPGVVAVLDAGGILVVITERKFVTENIDVFELLGFDVRGMQAVAFKGLGLHVRQALATKITRFLAIDGDGATHPDVRRLGTFAQINRPVWPLDDEGIVAAADGLTLEPAT